MPKATLNHANACDPVQQSQRQAELEELYQRDGRDRKSHPMHALYTGLWQQWTQDPQNDGI